MRIAKKVRKIGDENRPWLLCCWQECEKDGVEMHKARVKEGTAGYCFYVFCSERHKMYWVNSHRDNGNLPAGWKYSVT